MAQPVRDQTLFVAFGVRLAERVADHGQAIAATANARASGPSAGIVGPRPPELPIGALSAGGAVWARVTLRALGTDTCGHVGTEPLPIALVAGLTPLFRAGQARRAAYAPGRRLTLAAIGTEPQRLELPILPLTFREFHALRLRDRYGPATVRNELPSGRGYGFRTHVCSTQPRGGRFHRDQALILSCLSLSL